MLFKQKKNSESRENLIYLALQFMYMSQDTFQQKTLYAAPTLAKG